MVADISAVDGGGLFVEADDGFLDGGEPMQDAGGALEVREERGGGGGKGRIGVWVAGSGLR